MRYFRYSEHQDSENKDFRANTVTLSEQEVLNYYWDCWYSSMCEKYGKQTVDQEYTQTDCIKDWKAAHRAWEVEDCQGEQ